MDSKLKIPPEIINNQDTPEEYHFFQTPVT